MINLDLSEHKNIKEILNKCGIVYTEVRRYVTGYCHKVYYVKGIDDEYILRISSPEASIYHLASLEWYPTLYHMGLPVPQILYSGSQDDDYYTIMTYLKGTDLGEVYHLLSDNDKRNIAKDIVKVQNTVATIPSKGYYGYSVEEHYNSWTDVIHQILDRSLANSHLYASP